METIFERQEQGERDEALLDRYNVVAFWSLPENVDSKQKKSFFFSKMEI